MNKQNERTEWMDLLEAINQLEIKGQSNIFYMYKIIGFIKSKITILDKAIEEERIGGSNVIQ